MATSPFSVFLFLSYSVLWFTEFSLGRALYMPDKLNQLIGTGEKKRLAIVIFRQLFQCWFNLFDRRQRTLLPLSRKLPILLPIKLLTQAFHHRWSQRSGKRLCNGKRKTAIEPCCSWQQGHRNGFCQTDWKQRGRLNLHQTSTRLLYKYSYGALQPRLDNSISRG